MEAPEFHLLRLGEDARPHRVGSSAELREASTALARAARRRLEIVSRHLDPAVYDTEAFCDAVSRFLLDSRRARVHIIVMDSTPVLATGHRLIGLAQRLSSYMEIRRPSRAQANFNRAFMLADRVGCIDRELADRYDGVVSFSDRRTAAALGETFDDMWSQAGPDPNLRRLSL